MLFRKPQKDFCIYLTFDDGPTPEVTEWVLETLNKENIKATFFCLGKLVEAFPEIFEAIKKQEHAIGNHGFEHINGWETSRKSYLENIEKGFEKTNSRLFRPPYGRMHPFLISKVQKKYQLTFWSVLTQDYNTNINPQKTIQKHLNKLQNGDILVFHDSEKAFENLKIMLPATINWGKEKRVVWEKL
jgi:peptidoglycan/xylan/chitin deacetylase (PgdA/CDA1 family)